MTSRGAVPKIKSGPGKRNEKGGREKAAYGAIFVRGETSIIRFSFFAGAGNQTIRRGGGGGKGESEHRQDPVDRPLRWLLTV